MREFVGCEFSQQHRAASSQRGDHGGIGCRHPMHRVARLPGGGHPRGVEQVLQRIRDPVERAEATASREFAAGFPRLLPGDSRSNVQECCDRAAGPADLI